MQLPSGLRTLASVALATMTTHGLLAGCGQDRGSHRTPEGADAKPDVVIDDPAIPLIVRGRWEIPMATDGQGEQRLVFGLLGSGTNSQPMSATVAASVRYTVDPSRFVTPTPIDVASFGSLDVTDLHDNELRICGAGGASQCSTGYIRIYTTGTPGSGLWNAAGGYGVPITTGAATVGLGTGGAAVVATAAIGSLNVLRLRDFTAAAALAVPIAADFTDAGAGAYATTLVLEYGVQ